MISSAPIAIFTQNDTSFLFNSFGLTMCILRRLMLVVLLSFFIQACDDGLEFGPPKTGPGNTIPPTTRPPQFTRLIGEDPENKVKAVLERTRNAAHEAVYAVTQIEIYKNSMSAADPNIQSQVTAHLTKANEALSAINDIKKAVENYKKLVKKKNAAAEDASKSDAERTQATNDAIQAAKDAETAAKDIESHRQTAENAQNAAKKLYDDYRSPPNVRQSAQTTINDALAKVAAALKFAQEKKAEVEKTIENIKAITNVSIVDELNQAQDKKNEIDEKIKDLEKYNNDIKSFKSVADDPNSDINTVEENAAKVSGLLKNAQLRRSSVDLSSTEAIYAQKKAEQKANQARMDVAEERINAAVKAIDQQIEEVRQKGSEVNKLAVKVPGNQTKVQEKINAARSAANEREVPEKGARRILNQYGLLVNDPDFIEKLEAAAKAAESHRDLALQALNKALELLKEAREIAEAEKPWSI